MKKSKTEMNGIKAGQHIDHTSDNEILSKHFGLQFEKIWNRTKKNNLFDKPVNIPIDLTEIPFYANMDDVGCQRKRVISETIKQTKTMSKKG